MKTNSLSENTRRSIFVRLILTLVSLRIPGLGQIFCGYSKRGFMIAGVVLALFVFSKCSGLMSYPRYGITTYYLFILISLCGAYDTFRISYYKNDSETTYGKWGYFLICAVIIFLLQYTVVNSLGYKSYRIANNSNDPTFTTNDGITAELINPKSNETISRNSFILFHPPGSVSGKVEFVKRVIAVAGDTFSIKNGIAYLNNKTLNETYVMKENNHSASSNNFGPVKVPAGFVFVLGDNRDESADSRHFGLVPVGSITAKVLYIWLSTNVHKIGVSA